jgi:membrane-associated phospholipid phosphatase
VLAAGVALWTLPPLVERELGAPACTCRTADVNGFDRGVIHPRKRGAGAASDVLATALMIAPVGLDALDARHGYAEDLLVMAQAVALNGALGQLVKLAVRRPRPFVYDLPASDPARASAESYVSFYSSHTSGAFAASLAYASTFALRHPDSEARWLVYGGAALAAGSVGVLRVLAGQHFPTDVIAGAAVGAAFGLVVPRLHRRPIIVPVPGGATLAFSGRF